MYEYQPPRAGRPGHRAIWSVFNSMVAAYPIDDKHAAQAAVMVRAELMEAVGDNARRRLRINPATLMDTARFEREVQVLKFHSGILD